MPLSDNAAGIAVAAIAVVAAPVSALTTWLLRRKERKQAADTTAVDAAHQAVEAMSAAMERLTDELERRNNEPDE